TTWVVRIASSMAVCCRTDTHTYTHTHRETERVLVDEHPQIPPLAHPRSPDPRPWSAPAQPTTRSLARRPSVRQAGGHSSPVSSRGLSGRCPVTQVFAWFATAWERFFDVAGDPLHEVGALIMGRRSFDMIYSEQGWVFPVGTAPDWPVVVLRPQPRAVEQK